jgi:hypothetical protein
VEPHAEPILLPAPPPPASPTVATAVLPVPGRAGKRGKATVALAGVLALAAAGVWLSTRTPRPNHPRPPAAHDTTAGTMAPVPAPTGAPAVPPLPSASPTPPAAGFVPARPVGPPQPAYPGKAQGTGLTARVTVEVEIDATGRVTKAHAAFLDAEKPIPWDLYPAFKEAAVRAARDLAFQPATRDGVAVSDKGRLEIEVRP